MKKISRGKGYVEVIYNILVIDEHIQCYFHG